MLLFGSAALWLLALLPFVNIPFLGSPLVFMLVYVWSRNYPTQMVSIMGLVTLQSFYLPFAFLAIDIITGKDPIPDILGILVGHLWHYLTDIYPQISGRHLLQTPLFLRRWVQQLGVGPPPPPSDRPQGFRAFRGSGRRLGAD
eukprot:jgi/Chrzof1/10849/Cz05g14130.t1